MTAEEWRKGRKNAGLTQVASAQALGVTQPYLSQLESGSRVAALPLARNGARLYKLATGLPLPPPASTAHRSPDDLQGALGSLGYPKFAHCASSELPNPAEVVFNVLTQNNLDTRLVEAVPWVLSRYLDLDWEWLRDSVKLRNAQNKLGYVVYLAKEVLKREEGEGEKIKRLSSWEVDLEAARLVGETTLCRESMPKAERTWLKDHRPQPAHHWNLLTSLSAEQLSYE